MAELSECLYLLVGNLMIVFTGTGLIAYLFVIVVLFRNRNKAPLNNTFYRMATSLGFGDMIGRSRLFCFTGYGTYDGTSTVSSLRRNKQCEGYRAQVLAVAVGRLHSLHRRL